jgi:hypothetical protein
VHVGMSHVKANQVRRNVNLTAAGPESMFGIYHQMIGQVKVVSFIPPY